MADAEMSNLYNVGDRFRTADLEAAVPTADLNPRTIESCIGAGNHRVG